MKGFKTEDLPEVGVVDKPPIAPLIKAVLLKSNSPSSSM
jgi:hypothetical protein